MATINLSVGEFKGDAVYRHIYKLEAVPSNHGPGIFYLFIHAQVAWGKAKDRREEVYTTAMQYSSDLGRNVAVAQPAHILASDVDQVAQRWLSFIAKSRTSSKPLDSRLAEQCEP
jgi:hypothetical protein